MKKKAQMLLDEQMLIYVEIEFERAGIDFTTETRVMDNGDLVVCITFDGCDPLVGKIGRAHV